MLTYDIYTDGSSRRGLTPCTGSCGWAAVIVRSGQKPIELSGGKGVRHPSTYAELWAVVEAIEWLVPKSRARIYTDCTFVLDGVVKLPEWQRDNWKPADRIIINRKLWKRLHTASQDMKISWYHIRDGHPYHDRADALARLMSKLYARA